MMMSKALPEFELTVRPEWIDHNGHMNVAYYVLAFDLATGAFYNGLGFGSDYTDTGFSMFTLGMNVDYLRELFEGDRALVRTQLLDADHKRVHYIHAMYPPGGGEPVATNECLAINIVMDRRRSAPFAPSIREHIDAMLAVHANHPVPDRAGRRLAIRRRGSTNR